MIAVMASCLPTTCPARCRFSTTWTSEPRVRWKAQTCQRAAHGHARGPLPSIPADCGRLCAWACSGIFNQPRIAKNPRRARVRAHGHGPSAENSWLADGIARAAAVIGPVALTPSSRKRSWRCACAHDGTRKRACRKGHEDLVIGAAYKRVGADGRGGAQRSLGAVWRKRSRRRLPVTHLANLLRPKPRRREAGARTRNGASRRRVAPRSSPPS